MFEVSAYAEPAFVISQLAQARLACSHLQLLPTQIGGARRLPAQSIDVLLSTCTPQLLIEFLVHQLQVAAVLPCLPQRSLDLLDPLSELPVALLQGGHLLLQLLDMVLFLKQGLLHRGAHELRAKTVEGRGR